MDKPFEVAVSFTDQVPENIPGEFISSLEDVGVDVETEKRQSGPYAGYEWLLPTAVIVYISDKYFGTMLQKMAEDHYSAIKNGLKRLISRTAGPDREIQLNYVASSPDKVSSNEAPPLSIYSKLSDGRPIKFVVEYLPDEEDVSKCINSMIEVMEKHYNEADDLEEKLGKCSDQEIVMRFDRKKERWYLASPDNE